VIQILMRREICANVEDAQDITDAGAAVNMGYVRGRSRVVVCEWRLLIHVSAQSCLTTRRMGHGIP